MQELANKSKYGEVREISAEDYIKEVNNAGEDIWVVLHLYKAGYDNKTMTKWIFAMNVAVWVLVKYLILAFRSVH